MTTDAHHPLSRREILAGGIAAALLPSTQCASAEVHSLATVAASKGLALGASFATHELDRLQGDRYAATYKREVAGITSDLEFKMDSLRPDADTLDFGAADRLVTFARENNLAVRGHTLIWNDFLPAWVKLLAPSEIERLLEAHILTVVERYRGRVTTWDVVNEPIAPWDKKPGNMRDGPFLEALGEDYIARSFRAARATDPTARLTLNEAHTETDDAHGQLFRDSLYALANRLKEAGAPVDAIGLQCHLKASAPYNFPKFAGFIESLAALGYKIEITELDVDDRALGGTRASRDANVADLYRRFLGPVLANKAVISLTLWQLADHTSWLNTALKPKRTARPLIYDAKYARKPAWYAVAEALSAMPPR